MSDVRHSCGIAAGTRRRNYPRIQRVIRHLPRARSPLRLVPVNPGRRADRVSPPRRPGDLRRGFHAQRHLGVRAKVRQTSTLRVSHAHAGAQQLPEGSTGVLSPARASARARYRGSAAAAALQVAAPEFLEAILADGRGELGTLAKHRAHVAGFGLDMSACATLSIRAPGLETAHQATDLDQGEFLGSEQTDPAPTGEHEAHRDCELGGLASSPWPHDGDEVGVVSHARAGSPAPRPPRTPGSVTPRRGDRRTRGSGPVAKATPIPQVERRAAGSAPRDESARASPRGAIRRRRSWPSLARPRRDRERGGQTADDEDQGQGSTLSEALGGHDVSRAGFVRRRERASLVPRDPGPPTSGSGHRGR